MSDQQTCQTSQRKASANKNIKKRRNLNTVCGLANSWQQWISENEAKQAAEPSGWCPSWMGEPTEVPKKTWIPKKSIARQKTEDAQNRSVASKGAPETEKVPLISSSIKTKLVVKTVTSHPQERSAGIKFLTNRIEKEAQPSNEDIDRLLKTRLSPTRRRKCTNMVSSLTQSWREVENEQKLQNEGAQEDEQLVGNADAKDARFERQAVNIKDDSGTSLTDSKKTFDAESYVRIKRPQVFMSGKEAVDANKICARSKKYSPVGDLKSRWQNWASEHTDTQKINPFSENFDYDYSMSLRLQKGQDGYGRPKEGTKTAERAKRAEQHIHREIDDMCYIIRIMADPDPDGKTRITFGELFERYVRISDKVVGILMRARKHGKVHFEGEMLWQGQDDGVIITLLV
ncbi:actin binding Rho activating protein b [Nerophis lumbriciformis]|uniref:actin binding Rho activating protein b n=1 Tax=Nerophis lumbriciformis TaxID=546530 RepID=UPI002AE086DA|nr:actin binding Rho activating protein b [Nerophis lumbriciformis]